MHLNAKPPVLVPYEYRQEIEKMSKAMLMDMVWSLAEQGHDSATMKRIRDERIIVQEWRDK